MSANTIVTTLRTSAMGSAGSGRATPHAWQKRARSELVSEHEGQIRIRTILVLGTRVAFFASMAP